MAKKELFSIKEMFDKISGKYDLLNRVLSLKHDVYWRKKMISYVKKSSKIVVLDLACGTGDVCFELVKKIGSRATIVGVDFSEEMLFLAKKKNRNPIFKNLNFVTADAFFLPFPKESFDVITIAFGIRNIQDRVKVLKRLYSLLKKGGRIIILELSVPENKIFRKIFLYYFNFILPRIAWLFSKNLEAYKYLPKSVADFHTSSDFMLIMEAAGFSKVSCVKLTKGIASLFFGYRS